MFKDKRLSKALRLSLLARRVDYEKHNALIWAECLTLITPATGTNAPKPPRIPPTRPPNSLLLELHIFNGHPFNDHWAYWIPSPGDPNIGVKIHATGDVRNGFIFEIKRSHDLRTSPDIPTKRIPLQWLDWQYVDEKVMFNDGVENIDSTPVCGFEERLYKVEVPEKTLNSVGDGGEGRAVGRRIVQRDCQTWIVESAEQLVREGILGREVGEFLRRIEQ
ncbi:uncharacterized protein BO80DRAFT_496399 [Aspergillus ibericus CBS 121593]|uniref:Uncharacterized protein n=1 Tax=Aspergillus ibericus CBS 121593 TaxID=1448316 RepID=A0A395GPC0_9EURO|nr:hypothetical protein BO80DRAFT_496399 [Aspergillus ibericus CBS 121593]RAK97345.1 hypothetical protein BO80DRAFT_496399 [Aspergillus ibericus CBS 121593]